MFSGTAKAILAADPEYQELLEKLKTAEQKEALDCLCNFLGEYIDFAEAERPSSELLDELFKKTQKYAIQSAEGLQKRLNTNVSVLAEELKEAEIEDNEGLYSSTRDLAGFLTDVLELLSKMLVADTRIEKIYTIEKYVSIAHWDAPVLTLACNEDAFRKAKPYIGDPAFFVNNILSKLAGV